MKEKVVGGIIDLLREYGDLIRWHHCGDSRRCTGHAGFPDFLIAGPLGCILAEVKPTEHDSLDPGQIAWRYLIRGSTPDGHQVWTESDLRSGRVKAAIESLL